MALKFKIGNVSTFKVSGVLNDEEGNPEAFDFKLTCHRHQVDQVKKMINADGDMVDFLEKVIISWTGVKNEDGSSVPYSAEALREVCKTTGMAALIYNTYLLESGARAKN